MNYETIRIEGDSFDAFSESFQRAFQSLDEDGRIMLKKCYSYFLADGGFEGLLKNMGNRNVKEIFSAVDGKLPISPIQEGHRDDLTFRLYEAPSEF